MTTAVTKVQPMEQCLLLVAQISPGWLYFEGKNWPGSTKSDSILQAAIKYWSQPQVFSIFRLMF
jgi:hypothetical protein